MSRHSKEHQIPNEALQVGVALGRVAGYLRDQTPSPSTTKRKQPIRLTAIDSLGSIMTVQSRVREPRPEKTPSTSRWNVLRRRIGRVGAGLSGYSLRIGVSKEKPSLPDQEVIVADKGKIVAKAPNPKTEGLWNNANKKRQTTDNLKVLGDFTKIASAALRRAGITDATEFNKLPSDKRRAMVGDSGVTLERLTDPITWQELESSQPSTED